MLQNLHNGQLPVVVGPSQLRTMAPELDMMSSMRAAEAQDCSTAAIDFTLQPMSLDG